MNYEFTEFDFFFKALISVNLHEFLRHLKDSDRFLKL